ncbi:hypothetical protein N656DRAFT_783761 [Canariomyces notabilis]|uniref:Uncharacterized protein n=1 Tax=Canariomyces notabilis TaxID=2074819 RepID=A0AAN6QEL0_9PEZI|nr:hypothetical protein N656DRAFT_783761 [Canariomyces arenarius]
MQLLWSSRAHRGCRFLGRGREADSDFELGRCARDTTWPESRPTSHRPGSWETDGVDPLFDPSYRDVLVPEAELRLGSETMGFVTSCTANSELPLPPTLKLAPSSSRPSLLHFNSRRLELGSALSRCCQSDGLVRSFRVQLSWVTEELHVG